MPSPNLPTGFDPTDPDICVERLPVEEFAELRKAAPIWWCAQEPGKSGGFRDGGYWAVTKLNDVKEVSRRSDVFSSYENCVIPRFNDDIAREDIELQRFVMLNMDAPHHTRLRKIISRGFTPRAVGRLRDELERAGTEDRQDRGRSGGRRLRRAGLVRAATAGHRGINGSAPRGPDGSVPLVQRNDRRG